MRIPPADKNGNDTIINARDLPQNPQDSAQNQATDSTNSPLPMIETLYSIHFTSKTLDNKPIIPLDTLKATLADFTPTLTFSAPYPQIYRISFKASDSRHAQEIAESIKNTLDNSALFSAIYANISRIYRASKANLPRDDKDANWRFIELADANSGIFVLHDTISQSEIPATPKEPPKEVVQTSPKAKVLLVFLSALFVSLFVVYLADFMEQNRDKLGLKDSTK